MTSSYSPTRIQNDPEIDRALGVLRSASFGEAAQQALIDLEEFVHSMVLLAQIERDLAGLVEIEPVTAVVEGWALALGHAQNAWLLTSVGSQIARLLAPQLSDPDVDRACQSREPQLQAGNTESPSRLILPVLHHDQPFGALVVERPDPFTPAEVRLLSSLALRTAVTLENTRLVAELQAANQAKSKFVSVVTHELRIPMTSIKGYTDLLRGGMMGPVNEAQLNFLNVIRNNVERMSALVSDLSDISRIETGRIAFTLRSLPLKMYINEVLQTYQPYFDEKHQLLAVHIPDDLPEVLADPNRVVQIMNNLLSNANKYTPEGGAIAVSAQVEPGRVRLEIKDNGIGISPEDQKKLFSQFFRSEDQAVRDQPGWGLGLHVARLLIELMGGKIGMSSALSEGSCFWFELPTARQEEEK